VKGGADGIHSFYRRGDCQGNALRRKSSNKKGENRNRGSRIREVGSVFCPVSNFGRFGLILHPFLEQGNPEKKIKIEEWFEEKSDPEPQTLKNSWTDSDI